ncbi:hypothetical protein O3M35_001215 [Rhynocoris fuscipes]|uniref:Mannosyltransferase n=1 Tax=Rhynocoris fuscipes TaxID=488301 RepID=A0AAW1DU42_9HEMI
MSNRRIQREQSDRFPCRFVAFIALLCARLVPALWTPYNDNQILPSTISRCLVAFASSACEMCFFKGVCREFGHHVGKITLIFLLSSAGMFSASFAFLYSTFLMDVTMLSLSAWYHRNYELAIFLSVISSFLSFTFAGLLRVPMILDFLLFSQKVDKAKKTWVVIGTITLDTMAYYFFSKEALHSISQEPWYFFYFYYGFLNFNFIFQLALSTPIALILVDKKISANARNPARIPYLLSILPLYLCLTVYHFQQQEKTFILPVYPLICLCGALTVDSVQRLYAKFFIKRSKHYHNYNLRITYPIVTITTILNIARIRALYSEV